MYIQFCIHLSENDENHEKNYKTGTCIYKTNYTRQGVISKVFNTVTHKIYICTSNVHNEVHCKLIYSDI